MKKFILYQHAGSSNHGCEALVRTVIQTICNAISEQVQFTLLTANKNEDIKYGLGDIKNLTISQLNKPMKHFSKNWIKLQLGKAICSKKLQMSARYNTDWMTEDATFIAIGGDNYCYNKGRLFYEVDKALKGQKILWGCSIEPNDMDEELIEHLKLFSAITVRETITFNALKDKGLSNVYLVPDTAFALSCEEKEKRKEDYIGINISPMIMKYTDNIKAVYQNYQNLISYILNNTTKKIMFLPHVVADGNDDRESVKTLIDNMDLPVDRITFVDDQNCIKLKDQIRQCDFFVGARTHATIAAYSSGVPTLTVGYSVKSKGIANDIFGTYDGYVISVDSMLTGNELTDSYIALQSNIEEMITKEKDYTQNALVRINEVYHTVLV